MNSQAYFEMADAESIHWWFVGRRNILQSLLAEMALSEKSQLLEIGCGTGGNLLMLANFGNVSALEMDASAIEIAKKKASEFCIIQLGQCPDAIPAYPKRFDLVCMFDVLEHVNEDGETLNVIAKLLAPGGRLVITVPAYQWLFGAHDTFLHHKRRYTAAKIRKIAVAAGFAVQRISYFNSLLFPLAVLARIKDKLFPGKHATGVGIPHAGVNALFRSVFSYERHLLKHVNLPFGMSLLCVLHKPG